MDIRVGDVLVMKKNHPCGNNEFTVVRSGMDFKLECKKCGHLVMTPRLKAEKNIKKVYYAVSNEKYGFSKFINYMPKIEFESGI